MPELPEVEVVRQGLAPLICGRRIDAVCCGDKRLRLPVDREGLRLQLVGARITEVGRRGKNLLVHSDRGSLLVIHLGMTGRLGLFPARSPAVVHDHLRFLLDNHLEMRFNDARRFGSVQLFTPAELTTGDPLAHLGPEPLGQGFTSGHLQKRAAGRRLPVKSFLMDNRVVAGIGNIYASE
ncbi:MAG: formamidopyrimidine-DNA glycosylase, partial [Desulfobulbaceae bacterium]|nr:formamidopyrimidine-DNA glycosylase [Desulfobulbaceae bacterium]